MGVISAVGVGASRGTAYELGPATNTFAGADLAAAEGARNTYAQDEANADWLQSYASNRRYVVQLSPTGASPTFYYLNRTTTIRNYLLVGANNTADLQAYDELTGIRDSSGDLERPDPTTRNILSMASSGERVYLLTAATGDGRLPSILTYDHGGQAQDGSGGTTNETITLPHPTGRNYQGVAVTPTRIYAAYTQRNAGAARDLRCRAAVLQRLYPRRSDERGPRYRQPSGARSGLGLLHLRHHCG